MNTPLLLKLPPVSMRGAHISEVSFPHPSSRVETSKGGSGSINPSNSTKSRRPTRRRPSSSKQTSAPDLLLSCTAFLMPAIALMATWQTGTLLVIAKTWVQVLPGLLTAVIAIAIYRVSLPHVAKGIRATTKKISKGEANAMALAFDGAVVVGKIACLAGGDTWLGYAMMALGVCLSAGYTQRGFTR